MNRLPFRLAAACLTTLVLLAGCAHVSNNSTSDTTYTPEIKAAVQSIAEMPDYKGMPYTGVPITIPGRIECENYDRGGEAIAYHDVDPENQGTTLGPSTYRMGEGVDTWMIHEDTGKAIGTALLAGDTYVGWVVEGEWLNYTVNVTIPGTYRIVAYYSASHPDTKVQIKVNGISAGYPLTLIPTQQVLTFTQQELGEIDLKSGKQVLTLDFLEKGDENWDFIDLELVHGNY